MNQGESRTAATSKALCDNSLQLEAAFKVELFVIIANGWKLLTIITKSSTLDFAAVLDPPLLTLKKHTV